MFNRVRRFWWRVKARLLFGQKIEVFGPFTVDNPANVRFGTKCAINSGVHLVGRTGIHIGNRVVLSAGVMLLDAGLTTDEYDDDGIRLYREGKVRIDDGAWIGAGAILLPGVTVGEGAVVGAGSVVTRDVPPNTTVVGNPARPIRRD